MHGIEAYVGNTDAFPVLQHWDYFNHAGVAPLPRVSADVFRSFAREAEEGAYLNTTWYKDVEALRDSTAKLINAASDEIALLKNTSEGLAMVANGIDWKRGDRIVTAATEYPANMYPWMDLSQRVGVELVTVPEQIAEDGSRRVPVNAVIAAADHPRTNWSRYRTSSSAPVSDMDIAAVGRFCRQRGILFNVDAIQSLGILPVDVAEMNIDYLSADGHKWLLGPEGAGIFYCRRELVARTRASVIGWMNTVNASNYDRYDFTLKPNAAKFECGTPNVPGFLAFKASMDLLLSVGIDAVASRLRVLTDRLIAGLRQSGFVIASPRGESEWSGIVSFSHPSRDLSLIPSTFRRERRTEIVLRRGRLRASPHFYNTESQIDELLSALVA